MRRHEEYFYTRDQVEDALTTGLDLLDSHGLSPSTHPELLVKIMELVAQKHIQFEQVQPVPLGGMAIPRNRH